jgi:hypothetical protein
MSRYFLRGVGCIALIAFVIMGCGENDPIATTVPKLTTVAVTAITPFTAESGGIIISDGGEEIVMLGVCWSTTPDPTVDDEKTTNGSGTADFSSSLANLTNNTTYYVRAYATNAIGTAYGNSVSFTTGEVSLPTLTTFIISKISIFTAESIGIITSDGGGTITARGTCWSTHESPTTADSKTTDGAGEETFASQLTGLTPRTTYYVRAYATNEAGTAYGDPIEFMTNDEFSGIYEVISGTVFWGLGDGSPNPALSGDYAEGLTWNMDGSLFGKDTVRFFPQHTAGSIPGLEALAIIDRSVINPDGSHPVKMINLLNGTLQNIPESENKFFPGSPGIPGATEKQSFLLNFQWVTGGIFNRSITNLRLKFEAEFNTE